ncbi:MAG: hypothetical protein QXL86_01210 [Candidatus Aenigmatarchaeota archaeon]
MIARTGAIIVGIIFLSFIAALLLVDLTSPKGFKQGESLSSFINFLSSSQEKLECDCEFSSQLQEYICNPFCGELSGRSCEKKSDCV